MSTTKEALVIANGNIYTADDLAGHITALGVKTGDCVCVHSAMSRIGWVCGAEQAVVLALLAAVGADGTVVMPAQSGSNSEPGKWSNPPVPKEWHQIVRDNMPAYHPGQSPTRGMGRVAELFRKWPGAVRSDHPNSSFAAWGAKAAEITHRHDLEYSLGEGSPCRALYDLDAKVLLLGVNFDNCTVMHLGEYRSGMRPGTVCGAAMTEDGQRIWREYADIETDDGEFLEAGKLLEQRGLVTHGKVGDADCKLFRAVDAVDTTCEYIKNKR